MSNSIQFHNFKSKPLEKEIEVKEKFTIKCGDCNKSLLDVIVLKVFSDKLTKLKVHCPCNGSSYLIPINGEYKICPSEGLNLKTIDTKESREDVWIV